jgi:hypothetical protein
MNAISKKHVSLHAKDPKKYSPICGSLKSWHITTNNIHHAHQQPKHVKASVNTTEQHLQRYNIINLPTYSTMSVEQKQPNAEDNSDDGDEQAGNDTCNDRQCACWQLNAMKRTLKLQVARKQRAIKEAKELRQCQETFETVMEEGEDARTELLMDNARLRIQVEQLRIRNQELNNSVERLKDAGHDVEARAYQRKRQHD